MNKKGKSSYGPKSVKARPGIGLSEVAMWERLKMALTIATDAASTRLPVFQAWVTRIQNFSTLAETAAGLQSIAVIGSALIAKATNLEINPFCLRSNASVSGAYNVRGPAEKVLYPASLMHRFDIGSNSSNPLNGQTFNKLEIIDKTLRIRGGQSLVNPLNDILHAASLLASEADATAALGAYIHVRQRYSRKPSVAEGSAKISNTTSLRHAISSWVSLDSEGGARAQAAVGGFLDAIFGIQRIRVGKPNEPDRQIAGDVILWKESIGQSMVNVDPKPDQIDLAIEVRDKLVSLVDCLSVLRKLGEAGVSKGAIVAIGRNQGAISQKDIELRALEAGVHLEIFTDWGLLIGQATLWSAKSDLTIAELAVETIRARAEQIRVSTAGVADWDRLTRHGDGSAN